MAGGGAGTEWTIGEWHSLAHIAVVGAVVYFGAKGAIKSALKSRSDDIGKKLVETKKELAQLSAKIEKARSDLANIEKTKAKLISEVTAEGERLAQKMIDEAQLTATRIAEDAKLSAKSEVREFERKLRQEIVNASVATCLETLHADKAKNGPIAKNVHERLFEKFVLEGARSFHG